MVELISGIFDYGVSATLMLLSGLGMANALLVISIIAGVILVLCYGKVSFQNRIRMVKQDIHGSLLEVALFRHAPALSLAAQFRMFLYGAKYLLLAVPPILILAVPCIFLFAQLQAWFGYTPVQPGTPIIIEAVTQPGSNTRLELTSNESVEITGPLTSDQGSHYVWRLVSQTTGTMPLALKVMEKTALSTQLRVDGTFARFETQVSDNWLDSLLYPSRVKIEAAVPQLKSFIIRYPEREILLAGFHMHWIIIFLIVSVISGFIGGKLLKVEL